MFIRYAAGILLFNVAGPSGAVLPPQAPPLQSTPGQYRPGPDEQQGAILAKAAFTETDDAKTLAGLDRAIAVLPRPTRFRGFIQCQRSHTLLLFGRIPDSKAAAEECSRLLPDVPMATYFLGRVLVASGSVGRGVDLLLEAIRLDPQLTNFSSVDDVQEWLHRLRYSNDGLRRDRLLLALAKAGYGDTRPELAGPAATAAIRSRLAAGDANGASSLLNLFLAPESALPLVVSKRFEPIWTAIDLWSGGDLHTQRVASVAAAKAAFERLPEEIETRWAYAARLENAGYLDDALALYRTVLDDPARWSDDRSQLGVAATGAARLLAWQGKFDEALAVRQRVMATSPLTAFPFMLNLYLNQAVLLIELDRRPEAARLLDAALAAWDESSPDALGGGAKLWFDALQSCLGSGPVATAAAARVADGQNLNGSAFALTRTCRNDVAGLATYLVGELATEDYDDELVYRLRRQLAGVQQAETAGDRVWRAAAQDARVRQRLDAISRPIPESYRAAASRWSN